MNRSDRYSRQVVFIGENAQESLKKARVAIIGCGALGSNVANLLARSGIGFIRLVDRDFVERSNLQRTIYDEDDVGKPKVYALADILKKMNSEIKCDAVFDDFNAFTAEFANDIDIIIDGTDNFYTRYLINDVAVKNKIPFIFGSVIRAEGLVANFSSERCFRCLFPKQPSAGSLDTCANAGVINPIVEMIASIQAMEAIKYLTKIAPLDKELIYIDLSKNKFRKTRIKKQNKCVTCVKRNFESLDRRGNLLIYQLCDSTQIVPRLATIDIERIAKLYKPNTNDHFITFDFRKRGITVFKNGRMLIRPNVSENAARSIYAEIISI